MKLMYFAPGISRPGSIIYDGMYMEESLYWKGSFNIFGGGLKSAIRTASKVLLQQCSTTYQLIGGPAVEQRSDRHGA